ncbi:MAG: hypothetical protein ACLFQU_07280 [Candidatus Kapaibacterium sp.]
MIYLILTIICSTSIALLLKNNDVKRGNALYLLSGNYFLAGLIGLYLYLSDPEAEFSVYSMLFGALLGITFLYSFFAFARSVNAAGTPLSTVSSRLSVIIPIALSILIYDEYPGLSKVGGFVFAIVTIILFYFSLRGHEGRKLVPKDLMYLLILLAGIGLNDFAMKVFSHWRPAAEKPLFVFMIFISAFVYTAIVIVLKNIPIERKTFTRGMILGVPNVFSTVFLLGALESLPGIVVYPVTNIGIILAVTFAALLIWRERLNRPGKLALIAGLFSILLLSL